MRRCPECNCWGGLHSSGCPGTPDDDDDTTDSTGRDEPDELDRAEYDRGKKLDDARETPE
jgi:hypothetical protein